MTGPRANPAAATGARADVTLTGDGPRDLLLLHGLGGDRHQPLQITGDSAPPGWRIIAPDQRAHGASDLDIADKHLNFHQLAQDIEDLLLHGHEPSRPTVVMGVSMGAAVALRLALRGRVQVAGLLLVRPAWLHEPNPPGLSPFPVIAHLLRTRGPAEGPREFASTSAYQDVAQVSVAAAQALLAQFTQTRAVDRAGRLERLPASAPYSCGDLRRLDLPVSVAFSPGDPVHPRPLAEALHQELAGSTLVEAPPRYESPDAHHAAVAGHLHALLSEVSSLTCYQNSGPRSVASKLV